jgi:hypothetical protein
MEYPLPAYTIKGAFREGGFDSTLSVNCKLTMGLLT